MLSDQMNTKVISYNSRTRSLTKLSDPRSQSRIEVFHHIPSFLSLENIVMERSEVLNVHKR